MSSLLSAGVWYPDRTRRAGPLSSQRATRRYGRTPRKSTQVLRQMVGRYRDRVREAWPEGVLFGMATRCPMPGRACAPVDSHHRAWACGRRGRCRPGGRWEGPASAVRPPCPAGGPCRSGGGMNPGRARRGWGSHPRMRSPRGSRIGSRARLAARLSPRISTVNPSPRSISSTGTNPRAMLSSLQCA